MNGINPYYKIEKLKKSMMAENSWKIYFLYNCSIVLLYLVLIKKKKG